jgi:hypothetical protein
MQYIYRLLGSAESAGLKPYQVPATKLWPATTKMGVHEVRASKFLLNDFAVTVRTTRMEGFKELVSVKRNHRTIADPDVAQRVIDAIRAAQPIR